MKQTITFLDLQGNEVKFTVSMFSQLYRIHLNNKACDFRKHSDDGHVVNIFPYAIKYESSYMLEKFVILQDGKEIFSITL